MFITLREYKDALRPSALLCSPTPVLIGTAVALRQLFNQGLGPDVRFWLTALLCCLTAVFIHSTCNLANDYFDGIRGTDEGRSSLSGAGADGSVPDLPRRGVAGGVEPRKVLLSAYLNILMACLAGLILCWVTGHWWMILAGIFCLLGAWFYTGGKHPYGYRAMGELSIMIFFGLVGVLATQYLETGSIDRHGFIGALVGGLICIPVLEINNYRDIDADPLAGKYTLSSFIGAKGTLILMGSCYALAVILGIVESWSLSGGSLAAAWPRLLCLLPVLVMTVATTVASCRNRFSRAFALSGYTDLLTGFCWLGVCLF